MPTQDSSKFYAKLELVEPNFDSPLTDLIIELNHLRKMRLRGSTPPRIFFQLKEIFHFLESLESARIEGNRTTLAEIVDQKIGATSTVSESFSEITNVERAITFIDQHVRDVPLNKLFLSEIHKIVVGGLSPEKEGDLTPGLYRKSQVKIAKAKHNPPDYTQVDGFMEELFNFIAAPASSKYDLLKVALAHHRFVWIHPFSNGNGRTVRLLTYAMLVKQGFNVDTGRILNPTAIFCNDRQKYYDQLSYADDGTKENLLKWCEYVLSGLKTEIDKIDKLLDYNYLSSAILLPALEFSLDRKIITPTEGKILRVAINEPIFQASHLRGLFPNKALSEISRHIRGLREKKMIVPVEENARKYHIHFHNSYLLRGVIEALKQNGFVPLKDETT